MQRPKIPSLQHLARIWNGSPDEICRRLVDMAENPPFFNYRPLHDAARDLLLFGIPEEQLASGIKQKERRPKVRSILLEALPFLCEHFSSAHPDFVHEVAGRQYAIGRNLRVPFDPGFVYGIGGKLHFSWLSFWKLNPLAGEQLALFVTLVEEMMLQDSDLEGAEFTILDFSAKRSGEHRRLEVLNAMEVPRVKEARKVEMLETFVDGFEMAVVQIADSTRRRRDGRAKDSVSDRTQMHLDIER